MTPTVLLVDDEVGMLNVLRRTLARESYRVLMSSSAPQALTLLKRHQVDVVVSDEKMPQMSGSEFLAEVCKTSPETARILLTGNPTLESALCGINDGRIFRYLTKPCPAAVFTAAIRDALAVRNLAVKSRRLLQVSRRQSQALRALESEHPGITAVHRTSKGSICVSVDAINLDTLVDEIEAELSRCELG